MRVTLTDEQEFLREAVAGVVSRDMTLGQVREWVDADAIEAADEVSRDQGWTGIGLAEEDGGQGGGVIELAVLAEQLGRGAVPWDRTLSGCLLARLLRGGDAGARDLAAAIAAGERTAAMVVDWRGPITSDGDLDRGPRSARVGFVGGAAGAGHLVLPIARGEQVDLLGLEAGTPSVSATRRRIVDRTRNLADVRLEEAAGQLLGTVDPAALRNAADTAAVLIAADALGAAGRMLEMTVAYVGERRQFGVPVGSFQAVKHAAAEMLVDVEAARSAVLYGAWAVEADVEPSLHASIAKEYGCGAAARVADKALFLHGAIGYTWEHDLQLLFKRAKSDLLFFGDPDLHLDRIATALRLSA